MNTNQNLGQNSFKFRNLSWLTIVLAVLAIITFILVSPQSGIRYFTTPMMGGGVLENSSEVRVSSGAPMMDKNSSGMIAPDYYPYPNPNVPITDTREFLKIYYNAYMRTRDVSGLTRRVETTVRGYSGRIDQQSSSDKSGYVNFAVPQSKFEAFRDEIESLVEKKFLTINMSSQNLLSQKISIEEQQKQADATLLNYKTARQEIVKNHNNLVQTLQAQIDADNQQIAILRAMPETQQTLIQIQTLTNETSSLKQQILNENASYTVNLKNADMNIKYGEDWKKAVQTQDKALMDNVATVSGTISIQWISLWDITRLYLPAYWIPTIFAVLAFLSFLRDRRRFGIV